MITSLSENNSTFSIRVESQEVKQKKEAVLCTASFWEYLLFCFDRTAKHIHATGKLIVSCFGRREFDGCGFIQF